MAQPIPCEHHPRGCSGCRAVRERETTRRYNERRKASRTEVNKAARSVYNKVYRAINITRISVREQERRSDPQFRQKAVEDMRNRRMSLPKSFEELLIEAEGKCGICRDNLVELKLRCCADHDHNTGKYRGILCLRCNLGLGMFKDNSRSLELASQYLLKWRSVASTELPRSMLTREEKQKSCPSARYPIKYTRTEEQIRAEEFCDICGLYLRSLPRRKTAIDHDHTSGYTRGLLCYNCNRGLGMFRETIAILNSAVRYLAYERFNP